MHAYYYYYLYFFQYFYADVSPRKNICQLYSAILYKLTEDQRPTTAVIEGNPLFSLVDIFV